jgi:hypothetical protein
MSAMVYAYCASVGVKAKLANNGDDCVVFMHKRDLSKFSSGLSKWFLEMGFTMKVEEPVYDFERIEFCQTKPVYDGERYVMVRNPRVSIAKDCVSLLPITNVKTFEKWYGTVGEAGVSLTGGIPIFQDFYDGMIRNSNGRRMGDCTLLDHGFFHMSIGMHRKVRPISQEARYSFYLAFGILPDMQMEVESYYRSTDMEHGPVRLGAPTYRNIWLRDWQ